ncbi:methyltransferase domain-containing protein [Oleomonas cavernae]|uniref:Methyltransferase domain-containing protein n=1 Tax=Oleomonas cavernae TaxID=2320859 RepID=A0A418WBA2_9PROT|nr:methyltransferase domain-containing protein [Oleomonas cavernae]RJF87254.1 methyltransferase domain-containing protein [Oleomonas cavernae]
MSDVLTGLHHSLVFNRRTRVLAEAITPLLPAGRVLDVGCGDGTIDALIMRQAKADGRKVEITGIDVMVRPVTHIPVRPYDGRTLPAADGGADAVLFVDVLHHTDDALVLLKEAARVAPAVIIKDHFLEGLAAGPTLRFMDWVGNAGHGVVLPYNYWTRAQWLAGFAAAGLKIDTLIEKIPLYPFPASLLFSRGLHFIARLTRA